MPLIRNQPKTRSTNTYQPSYVHNKSSPWNFTKQTHAKVLHFWRVPHQKVAKHIASDKGASDKNDFAQFHFQILCKDANSWFWGFRELYEFIILKFLPRVCFHYENLCYGDGRSTIGLLKTKGAKGSGVVPHLEEEKISSNFVLRDFASPSGQHDSYGELHATLREQVGE